MKRSVPRANNLVFGAGRPEEGIQIFSAGFFRGGQRPRELEREYFETYYPLDERIPRLRLLPDSQLVPTTDLYTAKELKTSATYNEVLARRHSQDGLNVRLDGPNGTRIIWVINDPIDGDGWSSVQIKSIRRLLPHIRQYVSVRHPLPDQRSDRVLRSGRIPVIVEASRDPVGHVQHLVRCPQQQGLRRPTTSAHRQIGL